MENGESYGESHCSQKVVDRMTTEEQVDMLRLRETIDRLATAIGALHITFYYFLSPFAR